MTQGNERVVPSSLVLDSGNPDALLRGFVIGLVAFLTVVDLFAAQAILPSLVTAYGVSPAVMGFAVNASTIGMAAAGLAVALFGRRIERRGGIILCLALLSIPTALLAVAPDLAWFTALRIVQGLLMSAAFTLTLAYLAENCSAADASSAFAAYITGNVASNLVGRLVSAGVADHFGLAANFYVFALLNLSGAVLVYAALQRTEPVASTVSGDAGAMAGWLAHLRSAPMRAGFATGFCILFAFIGTFTYVNFVLVAAPLSIGPMAVGFVYVVFLPAIVTTPLAGRAVLRWGARPSIWGAFAVAGAGLPLVLAPHLPVVMTGLALIGVGTFFAQAIATGFVSRAATRDRAAASGIYLASYFLGGMAGSAVLGQVFVQSGWAAAVIGIGLALALAAALAARMQEEPRRQPA